MMPTRSITSTSRSARPPTTRRGDCPGGRCIVAAIAADHAVLANPASSIEDRAEALRFLIHFMGDLHQPMHVADNGDRGGNRRIVYLDGDSTNLHAVWDGKLLERAG